MYVQAAQQPYSPLTDEELWGVKVPEVFEIGGKKFHLAGQTTARHDIFTTRQIAACGVSMVAQLDGETEEQFQYRLYRSAMSSGDVFLLLGALLVPDGTPQLGWTEQTAKETAEFLGNLTDPSDKTKVRILLASALLPFFVSGSRSLRTSPKSSPVPGSDLHPIASGATPNTATGA